MKKTIFLLLSLFWVITSNAQNVSAGLQKAVDRFVKDAQLQQAMVSLYVANAATGQPVFALNAELGMAPASTLKIVTSATAYALLGPTFRYRTRFAILKKGTTSSLLVRPAGDPTLGSWRWKETSETAVVQRIVAAVRQSGAGPVGNIVLYNKDWNEEAIPGGWTWEDMGNYYGAGAFGLNWRENQFDILLRSGDSAGAETSIVATEPKLYDHTLNNRVKAAAKGTGDQTLVYLPLMSREGTIRGTIPMGEQRFKVSAAMPNPPHQFAETLKAALQQAALLSEAAPALVLEDAAELPAVMHEEVSPPLDSIIYWFNQKSINLYGEALLKTVALQQGKGSATEDGVNVAKSFWKKWGIPETELNMVDGSGLSPANRITTRAQVAVLVYARKQPWFSPYFASLPLYNGMKMKSGTIGGVKDFAGYHTAANGITYAFSMLVNNYNGSSSALVPKMYAVLDQLK